MNNTIISPTGNLTIDLKTVFSSSGMKLKDINAEFNKRRGVDLGYQNFSNRLSRGTFKYQEVVTLLDIVGYNIQWIKRS